MSLILHAVLLRCRMQKNIFFYMRASKWSACENKPKFFTVLFPSSPLQFFSHPLLSLSPYPDIYLSLLSSPLLPLSPLLRRAGADSGKRLGNQELAAGDSARRLAGLRQCYQVRIRCRGPSRISGANDNGGGGRRIGAGSNAGVGVGIRRRWRGRWWGGGSCAPTASGADLIDDGSGLGFGVYFYLLFSSPNLFLHVAGISDHIKKISFLHVVALPACENPIFAPFAVCGCIGRMQKSLNYTRM